MDWRERYEQGDTPWDMGRAHPELARRLQQGAFDNEVRARCRVLVPGCGRGHDALALARAGLQVTAVDVVEQLATTLGPALAALGGRFVAGDALALREAYDALFEHTFLCALPPARRADYATMAAACVRPGGYLHAVVFPIGKQPADVGPPYALSTALVSQTLGEAFALEEDTPSALEDRSWGARWARFVRVT